VQNKILILFFSLHYSRPLSRDSKYAEMEDSNSFRLRFEQELRDLIAKLQK